MPNFAKIYLIGHVGNIKTRYTPNGKQIINFSVAVNRRVNNEDFTDWYYINSTQEWLLDELDVGDLVFIEGTPQISEYNNQRYMNIWLNKIRILVRKGNGDNEFSNTVEPEPVESDEVPF